MAEEIQLPGAQAGGVFGSGASATEEGTTTKTKQTTEEVPGPNFEDILKESGGKTSGGGGGGGGGRASSRQIAVAQFEQQLISKYVEMWGTPPPPGYIEDIMASKMNIFEFEAHERAKPAFKRSPRYQEERIGIELQLAQRLGGLG